MNSIRSIKVVWLCNFVNNEMNLYFSTNIKELSPWVNGLIKLFENNTNIDLYIVAPNVYTNKTTFFKKEGIKYYFYQYRSRIIPRSLYNRFRLDFRSNFWGIKRRVENIVNQINPDLVHLIGAENPYYSSAIFPLFKEHRVLVSIQGFVRHASNSGYVHEKRVQIEEKILKKASHIGIQAEFMKEVINSINPKAEIIKHDYPNTIPEIIKTSSVENRYDFVFFARVIKDKGIEDLLYVISRLKKRKNDISLLVIGKILKPYEVQLKNLIQKLDIFNNVVFSGFLTTQQDVYKEAISARICVLPTYHDIIPGTLVESILMKLPAIAYNVGGVPDLNLRNECLILVGKKNLKELEEKMWDLLNDNQKQVKLAEIAYSTIKEQFDNEKIPTDYLQIYNGIINN